MKNTRGHASQRRESSLFTLSCAAGAWHLGGWSQMRSGCGRRDIGHGRRAIGRNLAMVGSFLLARPGGAAWGGTMQHCVLPSTLPANCTTKNVVEL